MAKKPEPTLFDNSEPPSEPTAGPQGVVVREVQCRKLLNRCGIDDYSFNCYVGCGHGCGYCYARFMQRFHPHDEEWGRFVDVRINAVQALARQLRRLEPGSVFTCSACDGWQPIEARYRLTRECCRLLVTAGFHLNILTKSKLVLRDLDILTGPRIQIGVTITTPDENWAAIWEPGASTVAERIEILRQAKAAGLRTVVMFAPLLPGISDTQEALGRLFAIAAETRVNRIWTDPINPRPRVWPAVQQVLRRRRPELYDHYQRVLFDAGFRRDYRRRLNARIRKAAQAAGLADRLA
jgi:DNA repair photolyase